MTTVRAYFIIMDIQTELNGKSNVGHTHSNSELTSLDWNKLLNVPNFAALYAALSHTHVADDDVVVKWENITGIPGQFASNTEYSEGLHANRPAAAAEQSGKYYLSTDLNGGTLWRCNGGAWVQISHGVNLASGEVTVAKLEVQIQTDLDFAECTAHLVAHSYHI